MSSQSDCECLEAGFCSRHQCYKTEHLLTLCRTRPDYRRMWDEGRGPGQSTQKRLATPGQLLRHRLFGETVPGDGTRPATVAVIVLSHNYGHFLEECLASVLNQTRRPDEILVIDDASTDNTREIAESYRSQGVRYEQVTCRNVHGSREAGFTATSSDVVCFLDADDLLTPDYLEKGLSEFVSDDIAIVYSDVEQFGAREGQSRYPARYDPAAMECDNYMHAGSLVRREAVTLSGAFEISINPLVTQGDWFLWRRVLSAGWNARKQSALYRYRQHGSNWSDEMKSAEPDYFEYAGLRFETITLFIALSGRQELWPELAGFLDRQTWPHQQVRLILMDTSQNVSFAGIIRHWIAGCDYLDVRHIVTSVGLPDLADDNRRNEDVQQHVRVAVARIYNHMAESVSTPFVWVVEDDILPPDNACEKLMRSFDFSTGSVSAAYLSRFDGKPCAWDRHLNHRPKRQTGIEQVAGNGFGCVLLRGGVVRNTIFHGSGDFDRVFYRELAARGLNAKLDWTVWCQHRAVTNGVSHDVTALTECECTEPGWCDRHQCPKTDHWYRLCRTRQEYFQKWEQGKGPGQGLFERIPAETTESGSRESGSDRDAPEKDSSFPVNEEPHLAGKALHFGQAVVRHLSDRFRKVDNEVYQTRLSACEGCEACDKRRMVCRDPACGCYVKWKARWRSEDCPRGHWPAFVEEESEVGS